MTALCPKCGDELDLESLPDCPVSFSAGGRHPGGVVRRCLTAILDVLIGQVISEEEPAPSCPRCHTPLEVPRAIF
jgi:hypothetical protein